MVDSAPTEPRQSVQRKILHCDCDCFYAAVEIRDNPELKGLPIAVGGSSSRRGVLTTCSYEARRFGIHSAMPTGHALRLCPDLLVLPVAMEKYRIASQQVRDIFLDFTELVEPLSLDEAFLDVSDSPHCQGSATRIAQSIRKRVENEVGITISAGVAPNKFLAKIASDWQKPDGLTVVQPHEVKDFVARLPVDKLYGVGKVTAAKMHRRGVRTCADLQLFTLPELRAQFGVFGTRLYELSRGIDERPVRNRRRRKSLSVERTLSQDLESLGACQKVLDDMLEELRSRLKAKAGEVPISKVFVKLRFSDFSRTTAEVTTERLEDGALKGLLETAWERKKLPVRLVGAGVRFQQVSQGQLELFE